MTDQELNARFENLAADIKADIAGIKADVAGNKSSLKAEISAEIKAEGATTRRHFDVVAESLRVGIKVIADGHASLHDDMVGVKTGQARLEVRQERLEIRQLALEHRQGKLEERQGNLEERVETLSEGQHELVTEVRLLAARLPA
jgi:predicted  nucleic acid-binding Zn-ribbon protein